MFVYVFGGAIQADGRYVDYVVPGIIVLCAGFGSASTAVAVAVDMTTGVIDRFRSLPIASGAVLTGHVTASVARNVVSTALVVGVALAAGFRPDADPARWLAAAGAAARADDRDLLARRPASGCSSRASRRANAITFVAAFAPYVSSAFVPAGVDAGRAAVDRRAPAGDADRRHHPRAHARRAASATRPCIALAWCAGRAHRSAACGASYLFRRR